MRLISRFINVRGELFASTFSYVLTSLIKLGSSLVLTRLLDPAAYGVIGILFSVAFVLELLSDVGTIGLLVRHERGSEKHFIHTVWTVRLIRSGLNFCVLYALSPLIADIYKLPLLKDALRLFSFWFLLQGLESMGFVLAQRAQRAKIGNYADLATNTVMTLFVIGLATVLQDYTVFIYGALLQRLLMTVISHFLYCDIGVGFAFDREASQAQFHFAKFVLPSSLLTIVLSQYDRVVLLKLFDLSLLGVYGLAGNMIGPVSGLINHNCRTVLYPRCAAYFRESLENKRQGTSNVNAAHRYYRENTKLIWTVTLLPVAVAGFAQSIIAILYDSRYAAAGGALMVLGFSALLGSFQGTSENLLVASGRTHVVLVANIVRVGTIVPFSLLGHWLFGFQGFLWFSLLSGAVVMGYFYREQRKDGSLDPRSELIRLGLALAVFSVCWLISQLLLQVLPIEAIHQALRLKRHGAH